MFAGFSGVHGCGYDDGFVVADGFLRIVQARVGAEPVVGKYDEVGEAYEGEGGVVVGGVCLAVAWGLGGDPLAAVVEDVVDESVVHVERVDALVGDEGDGYSEFECVASCGGGDVVVVA